MRRIMVLLISAVLLAGCLLAFCACGVLPSAQDGAVDIVLGASPKVGDAQITEEEGDSFVFEGVAYEDIFANIPAVDVPDPVPATVGLTFAPNADRTAYIVIEYNKRGLDVDASLSTDVYIPYTYEGLPVVAIAPNAFANDVITSITLPKTLLVIGEMAFRDADISSITIPASVLDIAQDAFIGCKSLSSITVEEGNARYAVEGNYLLDGSTLVRGFGNGTIPAGITEIAPFAFKGSALLTEITVPATVTKIGAGAFANCTNLASATIEPAITSVPSNMFDGCTSLTSVVLPDSVTTYEYACFRNTGFVTYTVPDSVTVIKGHAFAESRALTNIVFGTGLLEIGGGAFENCVLLTDLILPTGTKRVGGNICNGCTSLANVHIPATVEHIGGGAFVNCYNLSSLYIPKSVSYVGDAILYGVDKSTVISIETSYIPLTWASSWNIYKIDNALESGKVPLVSNALTVKRNVPAP